MLNLEFSDDHKLLRDSVARFFEDESSVARVRAAEPLGFDPVLYRSLAEMGMLGLRAPEAAGGSATGLMDAVIVAEEAGRQLASAPLAEAMVAARLLGELGGAETAGWAERLIAGEAVVTLALHEVRPGRAQVVPAGAVADAVLILEGDTVSLVTLTPAGQARPNHGSQPIASLVLSGPGAAGETILVAKGPEARQAFLAGREEWKLLVAAQLNGLSRRALDYAVEYAKERIQFDRPIGLYQAIAHPLADRAVDIDAAQLFVWWTIQQIAEGTADAGAAVAMAYWWAAKVADETTRRAVHTFGGYGVTLEYDLQLFFRRAKAWPLVLGDPLDELAEGGRRLWLGAAAPLPPAGDPGLDFGFGAEAEALAQETRDLLARITTPEWRAKAHYSYEGYDPEVNRKIGEAGLVHPSWPVEWGGRGAHPFAAALSLSVWDEFNVTGHAQSVSHFVGATLLECASDELKDEILLDIGKGITNCSLGYSEPSSGSDIFAAKTRAVWDEAAQEWVINGQKMFTSGAELTDYIFLLTRTDPEARKHAGITMFLVPKTTPGVEVHPVHTMQEERTNATFYTDVRLSDRYRIGEVNGGLRVLGAALKLEHGAGYNPGNHHLVEAAVEWARQPGADGRPRIEDKATLVRIARVKANAYMKELIAKRAMYFGVNHPERRTAYGPMNKLFGSEAYQRDMSDLIDLTAPDSLFHGREGLGAIELGHRHAQISTIYGGTSEVHRSMVAEVGLGLPRSR
jgi:alkylation response protein AidB-like acyl-CoA dehydrogenase